MHLFCIPYCYMWLEQWVSNPPACVLEENQKLFYTFDVYFSVCICVYTGMYMLVI